MKSKLIYLILCCFTLSQTADAQFLKNLKKKAQDAVERSILKKTEEVVTEEAEKALNGESGEERDEGKEGNSNAKNVTANQASGPMTPGMNPFGSGQAPDNLPATYAFAWEFKTKIEIEGKRKKDNAEMEMNYFINKNKDYYAVEYENEELKNSGGKATMVFDFKSEAMVMLSNYSGQRMAMLMNMKDPSKAKIE